MQGLEKVEHIYQNRDERIRELKAAGKKVIGYLCYFAPPEMITAAGMVPYRILGRMDENITDADSYLESFGCPYVRNCFDQSLKGHYDFLDGLLISHSCDIVQRAFGMWQNQLNYPYAYLFNVPHTVQEWTIDFFKRELTFYKESLEEFSGNKITEDGLKEAIHLHNETRSMMRKLYEMRAEDEARITGAEILKTLIAGMSIPAEEFRTLLQEVLEEVEKRPSAVAGGTRVMLWGSIVDDVKLVEMIERQGMHIVTDDTCIGTRCFNMDVPESDDVMAALSLRYFEKFNCPRTYRGSDMNRYQYLKKMAEMYRIKGVIGYILAFCDVHNADYPDVRDMLEQEGYSVLLLRDDYTLSNHEAVSTRLESFSEMLQV